MSIETEVGVIGAGIMGLSAAWELAKRGRTVLCLDRSWPGREASGSNAGTLAVQNKQLQAVRLAMEGVQRWQELASELDWDIEYERRGGLRVAHTPAEVSRLEDSVAAQRRLGVPVEMTYPPELFVLAPYLSRDVRAAGYCSVDGMVSPFAAIRAFVRACKREGVRFRFNCGVSGISVQADGSFEIRAGAVSIRCEAVLVAAGAWIADLCEPLGIKLPLYEKVQQVLITDPGRRLFPEVLTHIGGRLTLKQHAVSGKVLIGGGWRGNGSGKADGHRVRWENVVHNVRLALNTVPQLGRTRMLRAWTGVEGRSPDRLPLIGTTGGPPNLHVLGCSAGGFTLGPLCGTLAAQRLTNEPSPLFSGEISANRFRVGDAAGTALGETP